MKTISVNIPEVFVKGLEELVQRDLYANRSEAIRVAIRDLLKRELYDADFRAKQQESENIECIDCIVKQKKQESKQSITI